MRRLFAAAPILGWGPIGAFIEWVIRKYADELFDVADSYFDVRNILIKNEELKKEYDRASTMLHIVARDHGIDSDAFRSERENHKKQLSKFVRVNRVS